MASTLSWSDALLWVRRPEAFERRVLLHIQDRVDVRKPSADMVWLRNLRKRLNQDQPTPIDALKTFGGGSAHNEHAWKKFVDDFERTVSQKIWERPSVGRVASEKVRVEGRPLGWLSIENVHVHYTCSWTLLTARDHFEEAALHAALGKRAETVESYNITPRGWAKRRLARDEIFEKCAAFMARFEAFSDGGHVS